MGLYRRVRPGTSFSLVRARTLRRSAQSAWSTVGPDEFFGRRSGAVATTSDSTAAGAAEHTISGSVATDSDSTASGTADHGVVASVVTASSSVAAGDALFVTPITMVGSTTSNSLPYGIGFTFIGQATVDALVQAAVEAATAPLLEQEASARAARARLPPESLGFVQRKVKKTSSS